MLGTTKKSWLRLRLLFFILFSLAQTNLSLASSIDELAQSDEWLFLMHYQPKLFGGYKGVATEPKFYLHPEGRYNPKLELNALVNAFTQKIGYIKPEDDPRCRFPFRYKWLRRNLKGFKGTPRPEVCPIYDEYIKKHDAKSVAIAFSSYNVSSPSSAFGHTLFRVSSKKSDESKSNDQKTELLDRGINYAANIPENTNPIWYAIGGMAGAFPGTFGSVPYYYKIREYNDFEARDIWTYRLDLSQQEVDDLMDHLWEMGNTPYDYYFLTENCAYYLLRALQAAIPRIQIMDKVPYWQIPGDTVRALQLVPGLVKGVEYRPSIRSVFNQRVESMAPANQEWVKKLSNGNAVVADIKNLTQAEQKDVLDAAIDYIEVSFPEVYYDKDGPVNARKFKLLTARARNPLETTPVNVPTPELARPDIGHESARWSFSGIQNRNEKFGLGLNIKFALHDILDSEVGYMRNSEVAFFNIQGEYWEEDSEFLLRQFGILEVVALPVYTRFQNKKSWKLKLLTEKRFDKNCLGCDVYGLEASFGRSWGLDQANDYVFYALFAMDLKASTHLPGSDLLTGVGPNLGTLVHIGPTTKFNLDYQYIHYIGPEREDFYRLQGEIRKGLETNWAAGLKWIHTEFEDRKYLQVYRYF